MSCSSAAVASGLTFDPQLGNSYIAKTEVLNQPSLVPSPDTLITYSI